MGLWKTPFTAHGKARVRLSHVLQTAFPTAPKEQPVTHIPTPPTTTEKNLSYLSFIKNIFKELIGNQERKHGLHGTRPYRGDAPPKPLQLNTAAPQDLRGVGTPPLYRAVFLCGGDHTLTAFCPLAGQPQTRQKGYIYGIFQ